VVICHVDHLSDLLVDVDFIVEVLEYLQEVVAWVAPAGREE
jgi:hypothetical protein